jgi:TPP-dependent pyruvate/acetoin dehydrogenase alpha subunit
MKRYPAFDPPEYVDWAPDPQLIEAYARTLEADPDRAEIAAGLTESDLLSLYRDLLRTRLHDIGLKRWVRTGVISKAWLGTGEEAVTVGTVRALDADRDIVSPMIRNAGALHMMGMSLSDMFRGYLATSDSPSGGRDLHIGDLESGIIQPISHMGTSVTIVAGVALAFRNRGEDRVALTWVGDGATKTAACHEGMNLAAVQDLPAIFVIQNNQVALGTRLDVHGAGDLHAWPAMYGIDAWSCDGNNVLDVYAATQIAADRCRNGLGPAAIVAETFRLGGHATHDEREARATFGEEIFAEWGRRDPIGLFEAYLGTRGIEPSLLTDIEANVTTEMDRAADEALQSRDRIPPPEQALYSGFSEGDTLVGLTNRPIQPHSA